ncbi:M17 family peptidase N-terminal domain-containing protein [Escherichia coli]
MEFSVKSGSPEKQRSACIVVGVFEPRRLSPIAEQLDKISDGYISALLRRGELEGKPGRLNLIAASRTKCAVRAYSADWLREASASWTSASTSRLFRKQSTP